MTRPTHQEHLAQAEAYAKPLLAEKDATKDVRNDPTAQERAALLADQGVALRGVLYHCAAALVAVIEDRWP